MTSFYNNTSKEPKVELEDICWLIAAVLWEMVRAALRDMPLRKDVANIERVPVVENRKTIPGPSFCG